MTFIDDEMSVIRHAVIDHTLADETLDQGDIEVSREFPVATAEASDRLRWQIEKRGQPLDPLLHQLLPVNQNQSVHATGGDEICGKHGFAEGGGGGQDTGIVREHGRGGGFLFRTQGAGELHIERFAGHALIADVEFDFQAAEKLQQLIEAIRAAGRCERSGPPRNQ